VEVYMANLSLEFWLGSILAIVLAVLAFGVGIGMDAKTKGEYLFVIGCFSVSWLVAIALLGLWNVNTTVSVVQRTALTILLGGLICFGALESIRWAQARHLRVKISEPVESKNASTTEETKNPSFLFILGAPLGDNYSDTWMMMLIHYGPNTVHGCRVTFYDEDRKNLEHEWLVKHPNVPYPPKDLFDSSKYSAYIPEANPEGLTAGGFQWKPLDPDRQHYGVAIECGDGVFGEELEITRVDGILRVRIVVQHGSEWMRKNPGKDPVIFQCQDPEFVRTPALTVKPTHKGIKVHAGWKPNHRMDVPTAIIDPNGNIQVVAGVKQPDGTILTDFGCWNLLTKHFGDTPSSKPPFHQ
jgi:hypothetical protein